MHHSPRATDPEVIEKITWLRQRPLRPSQDRHVPAALPRRGHQHPGAWRILKRLSMNRLPASQRY